MNLTQKLALGTVQFGLDYGISNDKGQTSEEEVLAILEYADRNGIKALDTAQAYGKSEEVLGNCHQNRFQIVTKIAPGDEVSTHDLFLKSLRQLQLDSIYGILFHNAESVLQKPDAFKELTDLKSQGKVQKIGFSVYTPEELKNLIMEIGMPDLIQIPYSHLDRRFESLAEKLHGEGVEIHTRSTFLQGLFFMKPTDLPDFFNPVKPYLNNLQANFNSSSGLSGFLLNYAVTRSFIDKVVIGVNNLKQLTENLETVANDQIYKNIDVPILSENILMPNLWEV